MPPPSEPLKPDGAEVEVLKPAGQVEMRCAEAGEFMVRWAEWVCSAINGGS